VGRKRGLVKEIYRWGSIRHFYRTHKGLVCKNRRKGGRTKQGGKNTRVIYIWGRVVTRVRVGGEGKGVLGERSVWRMRCFERTERKIGKEVRCLGDL